MAFKKNNSPNLQAVAIGIAAQELFALTLERVGTQQVVNCVRKKWRKTARDLGTDQGQAELTAALTELASEVKLQGLPLHVALSSDFCVTRVVSGENEAVQREVQELCERSRAYLSLGVGEKTYAISEAVIDARRKHTWVSVANQRVLTAIFGAFNAARLSLVRIEHSLSALSRLVHEMHADDANPVLAIDLSQRVVDVGICFKGQLLLDYRPSGANAKESAGIIITRHTKRLQRYLDRLMKRESAQINRICMCGDLPDLGDARQKLEEKTAMAVQLLDPSMVAGDWHLMEDVAHDHRICGAFGMLLMQCRRGGQTEYPNLLDSLTAGQRGPLLKKVIQLTWPVMATAAASIALSIGGTLKQWECARQEADLEATAQDFALVGRHQQELQRIDSRIAHLSKITDRIEQPSFDKMMSSVGQSLPRGVWLQAFHADRAGEVTISGTSHSQDGVFEFMRHLRNIPNLSSIALESTAQTLLSTGPAVQFVVKASSKTAEKSVVNTKPPIVPRSARTDAQDLVDRLQRAGVLIRGEVILR